MLAARAARPEIKILIGGPLLDKVPGVWQQLGADGGAATVDQALSKAADLVGIE